MKSLVLQNEALPYAEAFDLSLAVGRRLQAAQVAYHVAVEPGGDLRVFTHEEVEKQQRGCTCTALSWFYHGLSWFYSCL